MGTKNTRKVYKLADREVDFIQAVNTHANDTLTKEEVNALIKQFLATQGNTSKSDQFPDKEENGVLMSYCSRFERYLPMDEMVTTKEGKSKGYSKESQDILTNTNKELKALQDEINAAIKITDFDTVTVKANEMRELEADKASGAIYK